MDNAFLQQTFVFLAAAIVLVPLARKLGLGSVLGYLVAGAVIGPFGLKLFGDPEAVMQAAEFGVVIMLFLIGLELQPMILWQMRRSIIGVGGAQVLLTGLALMGVALLFGLDWHMAAAVGFVLALSSTAIVMQTLRERALIETQAGRSSFAVLLFQDIAVIPMLALFPLLATLAPTESTGHSEAALLAHAPPWLRVLATLAAVGALVLAGRFIMRPIFRIVARARMQELFTATALVIVVGATLLMEAVSLSPALGAFIAGVMLADSEFRHEIEGDIEPFRGLLLGLFFVSVGACVNFALFMTQPWLILGLALGLIVVKAAVLYGVQRLFRQDRAESVTVALALAQGGEFAFVLCAFAQGEGVLPASIIDPLIVVVAISMAVTPLLFILAERIAGRLVSPVGTRLEEAIESNKPHAIIAGYGRVGQTAGRLLNANGYRTSVLDHDIEQVEVLREFGRKVNYGDASRVDLLRAAGAEEASIIIIAIDDQAKALQLVDTVRRHFPKLQIIARAFDRRHAYEFLAKNVEIVERETFESSVRLGAKALVSLGYAPFKAEKAAELFRKYDERLLREMAAESREDFAAFQKVVRDRSAMFEELMRADMEALRAANEQDRDAVESAAGSG